MWQRLLGWIQEVLFITKWLPDYSRNKLQSDATAGLTVGVMLIPQAMAYAVIAGLPPIYGLYAALVPLLIYPLLGTSRQVSFGPTALDMLILGAALAPMAVSGSDRYVELAILTTAMVGVMQFAMGTMQLGFVANLLSRPVVTGLTAAAALIIGVSQLGTLLGIELANSEFVHVLIWSALQNLSELHVASLVIGGTGIVLLVLLPRFFPRFPDALFVVALATGASYLFDFQSLGVEIIGDIPSGLPPATIPSVGFEDVRNLFPAALTLAAIQFMKDVSLGRVFATRHRYTIDANRELLGNGAANFIGSFFSSIPASSSFSRSAVNDQAGARTPLSNVFAAVVVGGTLLFLTPLFYYLPMPVLAAIIMVAGLSLIDFGELRSLFDARRRDGYIALFTAGCVLFIGIQEGILIGIAASVIAILFRISRPNVAELGHVPGTRLFRDRERFEQALRIKDIMILRVDAAFSFANAEYFKDFILEKSEREGRRIEVVIVDGTSINDLDTTAIEALESTIETLEDAGIELHFTGLIGPVREVVRRSGLYDRLGEDHFHMDPHDAVVQVLKEWDDEDDGRRERSFVHKVETEERESTPAAS